MTDFHILIPARMGSTRLANKAMADVAGMPLVRRVWHRAMASNAKSVHVLTDHKDIFNAIQDAGGQALMTRSDHVSGTDRLAEAVDQLAFGGGEIIVNLQGDEPLMPVACLQQVAQVLGADPQAQMATLFDVILDEQQWRDPDVVKVLVSSSNQALCFSRAAIPHFRDGAFVPSLVRRHVGLYAYRVSALKTWSSLPPSDIERAESLEQWRALEAGWRIAIAKSVEKIPSGVDNEHDLKEVRNFFGSQV